MRPVDRAGGHRPVIEVGSQDTLEAVLDRAGISLRCPPQGGKTYGGHRSHLFCPKCNGGAKREKNFFVTIDDDATGATWICWRSNSCGYADGFRLHGAPAPEKGRRKPIRRPDPEPNPELPDKLVEYFAGFGISRQTLEAFGIYRTERLMPVLSDDGVQTRETARRPCIAYPYVRDGELCPAGGRRWLQDKQHMPVPARRRRLRRWPCELQTELHLGGYAEVASGPCRQASSRPAPNAYRSRFPA